MLARAYPVRRSWCGGGQCRTHCTFPGRQSARHGTGAAPCRRPSAASWQYPRPLPRLVAAGRLGHTPPAFRRFGKGEGEGLQGRAAWQPAGRKRSRPSRSRVPAAGRPRAASSPPSRRRPAMLHGVGDQIGQRGYANAAAAAAAARRYRMRSTTTSDSRNMPMPPPIMATHANIFSHRFTPRRGTGGVMNLSLSASCRAPGGTWPATRSGRSGSRAA